MIALHVSGFALEPATQMPIALLKEEGLGRLLPIQVEPYEARSIILELEGIHPGSLLSHELFIRFFNRHGFTLESCEITGRSGPYQCEALIRYRLGPYQFHLGSRPSDAIALALRLSVPILAREDLLVSTVPDFGLSPEWTAAVPQGANRPAARSRSP